MPSFSTNLLRAVAIAVLMLLSVSGASAQCGASNLDARVLPSLPAPKPVREEPILPEAGFLSDTHYTSQFFGFSFDLPLTVHGHEIMMPVMPEKQHVLLALQYEQGRRKGYIEVTAYDPVPGFDVNTPEEKEKELREWAKTGTEAGGLPQIPIPPFMLRSGRFYHRMTRRGRNYEAQYWTGINNYTVEVVVATNDEEFLRKAKDAMAGVQFYCPQDDGTLTTEDGKPVKVQGHPYTGPTVPTFRVNAALHDEPGKNIPAGEVANGVYRNQDIGVQYELPKGWVRVSADKLDPPFQPTGLREYEFLHACSRTLLEIGPPQPGGADAPLDSAIVLRALDPNCLSMRTAASLTDKRAIDEVAASLEQLGEFGDIGSDELMSISGHLFMIFHGTMATSSSGEGLAQRLSENIFLTRYNKLLLVWSALAPSATALDAMPTGGVSFEGSSPIQLHAVKTEQFRKAASK